MAEIIINESGDKIEVLPVSNILGQLTISRHIGCDNSYTFDREISRTHKAFLCKGCLLRVPYPKTIKTIHQLIEYFESRYKSDKPTQDIDKVVSEIARQGKEFWQDNK